MRVLILASSSQKASVADKLLNYPGLSKVLVSRGSNKLVSKAQALIVYFESKEDLKKLKKLRQIYLGVPLKFYFGNQQHGAKWTTFFDFKSGTELCKRIVEEYEKVKIGAEAIFLHIIKQEGQEEESKFDDDKSDKNDKVSDAVTVQDLLRDLTENQRDVIEEKCIELFAPKDLKTAKKGAGLNAKDTEVSKEKFTYWWSQGKLDGFEMIKYYLIDWIMREIERKSKDFLYQRTNENGEKDPIALGKDDLKNMFIDYQRKNQSKIKLTEHYECNFKLQVPVAPKEEKKNEKPLLGKLANKPPKGIEAVVQSSAAASGTIQMGEAKSQSNLLVPLLNLGKDESNIATDTPNEGATLAPQVDTQKKTEAVIDQSQVLQNGTVLEFKVQFFPNSNDDSIVYYKNLHMFRSKSWFSVGLKPKAKDLKTVIDDFKQMEYLQTLENQESIKSTIVLDGRKVRLGFEGPSLDQLSQKYSDQANKLKVLCTLEDKQIESEIEVKLVLNQKLDALLYSDDPIIYSILSGMLLNSSLKFHKKQFVPILETTTGKKFIDKLGRIKSGDSASGENEDEEQHEEESGSESDDYNNGGSDNEEEREKQKLKEEEEAKKKEKFDLNNLFKYLLPTFLFRWNGDVTISPDLNEIKQYCVEHQTESYILNSFKQLAKSINNVEDINSKDKAGKKRGTKRELYSYLTTEVGNEIEFTWMTENFFLKGQIKSEELGKALKYLSNAKFL